MPFQVSRTDTGQFVLTDLATDTVVIADELAAGYDELERSVAEAGDGKSAVAGGSAGAPASDSSVFPFRGGPRYTPIVLAVVLPFAWLAVFYFALASLLAEYALDRRAHDETQDQLEELEREVQALRSEVAGAPRTAKTEAKAQAQPKRELEPKPPAKAADKSVDDGEVEDDPPVVLNARDPEPG